MKKMNKSLLETISSISDLDIIFQEVSEQPEDKRVDYFFNAFSDYPLDTIMGLWDYYLDLEETMQTGIGSGIDKTIGFNRRYGYDTELVDLY